MKTLGQYREAKAMRMLRRDPEMSEEFYERYRLMILKIARKVISLGSNVSFEDLVQTGALALFHAKELYDYSSPRFAGSKKTRFSTYAHAWIKGLMMNVKAAPREELLLDEPVKGDEPDGTTFMDLLPVETPDVERELLIESLWRAVDLLPLNVQKVMILRYRHGLTLREAAAILKISFQAVDQTERRGIRLLKERFGVDTDLKAA